MKRLRILFTLIVTTLAVLAAGPGPAAPAESAFPGTNGKIVFGSDRDHPNGEIYSMNADGSAVIRLTNNSAQDQRPTWSPDGTKIAFDSNRDGNAEVYAMNADGAAQTRLTNNAATDSTPTWSPDATKVAFLSTRAGNAEVYVMNADGSGPANLTNNPAGEFAPSWSPDGSKIAFESNRDGNTEMYVMNADGSAQARLTNNVAIDSRANWSPDGAKIAFESTRDGGLAEIYVMNADGSAQTRLTIDQGGNFAPAWSPDGAKITFTANRDGNSEIYVMNANGSAQTRLTINLAGDTEPDWQPLTPCTDADADGICNSGDNCPNWPNPAQNLPPWSVPPNDPDCDSFSTTVENSAGTNATAHCGLNAWPADINSDTFVDVIGDIAVVAGHFTERQAPLNVRYDISLDPVGGFSYIDIFDIVRLAGLFGQSCN